MVILPILLLVLITFSGACFYLVKKANISSIKFMVLGLVISVIGGIIVLASLLVKPGQYNMYHVFIGINVILVGIIFTLFGFLLKINRFKRRELILYLNMVTF